jgi:hypothetical protein
MIWLGMMFFCRMFDWDSDAGVPWKKGVSVMIGAETNIIATVGLEHAMPPAAASQLYDKLFALMKRTYAADKFFCFHLMFQRGRGKDSQISDLTKTIRNSTFRKVRLGYWKIKGLFRNNGVVQE